MPNSNSKLVYSTDQGRVKNTKHKPSPPKSDGIIRIQRETKGRKGKGVTCIRGFTLEQVELKALAKKLKQIVGTGGTAKDGMIEIQGDQRDVLKTTLEGMGYIVKLAGG